MRMKSLLKTKVWENREEMEAKEKWETQEAVRDSQSVRVYVFDTG